MEPAEVQIDLLTPVECYPSWTRLLATQPLKWGVPSSCSVVFLVPGTGWSLFMLSAPSACGAQLSLESLELLKSVGFTSVPCRVTLLPPILSYPLTPSLRTPQKHQAIALFVDMIWP